MLARWLTGMRGHCRFDRQKNHEDTSISDHTAATASNAADTIHPRRPVRANGRRRYELLLDAAERLLQRGEREALTIQNLAREAAVPMASVYHFLPNPTAVSVALAERYLEGLEAAICASIGDAAVLDWPQLVRVLNRRAVGFYREHPYAQSLILGSDHSWAIRQADLANNRRMADAIAGFLADKFPEIDAEALLEIVVTGITIGDALFTLSIGEHGEITDRMADEAWLAVCSYLSVRCNRPLAVAAT